MRVVSAKVRAMRHLSVLALAALLAGCATASPYFFQRNGYRHPDYAYSVKYRSAASDLLGADWLIENFTNDGLGWVPKTGDKYVGSREIDWSDDGEIQSGERRRESFFDLRFSNRRDNGVIWVKAHPLPPKAAGLRLDVVLDNYADGLSGGAVYESLSPYNTVVAKSRRFTTLVTDTAPATLGGHPAIKGTVEIADVDRIKVDSNHRDSKVRVYFAKFLYEPGKMRIMPALADERAEKQRIALLVVGYHNSAQYFDAHLKEFDEFVGRVAFPPGVSPPDAQPLPAAASAQPALSASPPAAPATSASAP